MSLTYPIQGKIALVTGANRGIGKAIVEGFLHNGASKVYAAVRNPASAQPLVDQYGDKVVPVAMDIADAESVAAAAKVTGDAQVVVNNAGVYDAGSPLDENWEDSFAYQFGINVKGLIHVARSYGPILAANGGGAFVQLNSVASLKAFTSLYSASKAASYSITQNLRDAFKEQGTLVISVHPGPIMTDMGREAGLEEIAEPPSQVADAIVAALADGTFQVYTDVLSRQMGSAYASYAETFILPELKVV